MSPCCDTALHGRATPDLLLSHATAAPAVCMQHLWSTPCTIHAAPVQQAMHHTCSTCGASHAPYDSSKCSRALFQDGLCLCSLHVASVLQMAHMLLCHGGFLKTNVFNGSLHLTTYWSAIIHDFQHAPGEPPSCASLCNFSRPQVSVYQGMHPSQA